MLCPLTTCMVIWQNLAEFSGKFRGGFISATQPDRQNPRTGQMMVSFAWLFVFAALPRTLGDSYLIGGSGTLCWVSKYVNGEFVSGPGSSLSQENSISCPSGMSIKFTTPKLGKPPPLCFGSTAPPPPMSSLQFSLTLAQPFRFFTSRSP